MKTQFGLKPFKTFDSPVAHVAVSSRTFYTAHANGEVVRMFSNSESEKIKFTLAAGAMSSFMAPSAVKVEVSRIYASPFHVLFSTTGMDTFYLALDSTTAIPITKMHGNVVTCLSWIDEHRIGESNFELIAGCQNGKVFKIVFEAKKEKSAYIVADFSNSRIVDIVSISQNSFYVSTSTCLFQVTSGSSPMLVCECPVPSLNNKLRMQENIYWINPVGIVQIIDAQIANVTTHSVITPGANVLPLDFVTTPFSHIVLYEGGKVCVVSKIAPGPFIATVSHSQALGFLSDNADSYLYSAQRMYQVMLTNESSDAWIYHVKNRNFAKALESTVVKSQRAYVLRAEADFLITNSKDSLEICAELYGKALAEDQVSTDSILDEIIVKLSPNKQSLLSFLMRKLDLTGANSYSTDSDLVVQVNVLFMYCCQLFIALMLETDSPLVKNAFLTFVEDKHTSLDIECIRTLTELLESVGLFDELVKVAELTGDLTTAIRIDLQRGNFLGIMDRLDRSESMVSLIPDLSSVLFRFCPTRFIAFLIKVDADPEPLITSVLAFSGALTPKHKEEASKFIYHCLASRASCSVNLLNALICLIAEPATEEELISLLESVASKPYFDSEFAMRRIRFMKLVKTEIVLLSLCGCFLDATRMALTHSYMDLAKSCAWRSRNSNTRSKCWLLVIKHLGSSVETIMDLFHESECVTVVDVLPILANVGADSIAVVKDEVTELVESLTKNRLELSKDIKDYQEALQLIRKDLNETPNTCLVLSHSQQCHICFELVYTEKFVAFNCSHCFHSECLKDAMASKLIGVANVEQVIESACCLCSDSLLMDQMFQPFIDPSLDADAIQAWAIRG